MKYQPGTKWNRTPTPAREAQEFHDYVQDLLKQSETNPEVLQRLMQRAGIVNENGNLAEKYRDPEQSQPANLGAHRGLSLVCPRLPRL